MLDRLSPSRVCGEDVFQVIAVLPCTGVRARWPDCPIIFERDDLAR